MRDEEVWIRAWCATLSHGPRPAALCKEYADEALRQFRETFPATPLPVIGG